MQPREHVLRYSRLALVSCTAIALALLAVVHVGLNRSRQSGRSGSGPVGPASDQQPSARPSITTTGAEEKSAGGDPHAHRTDLETLHALFEQIRIEQAKPVTWQNYAEIKAALAEIAARKDSGKVATYAEYMLERLEPEYPLPKPLKQLSAELRSRREYREISDRLGPIIAAQLSELCECVVGKLDSRVDSGVNWLCLKDDAGKSVSYLGQQNRHPEIAASSSATASP